VAGLWYAADADLTSLLGPVLRTVPLDVASRRDMNEWLRATAF
jgi:hypothetical protein